MVNVGKGKLNLWKDLNVDQIWAEAVEAYKTGEELYLDDEIEKIAIKVQADHTEESDKAGIVYEYLEKLLPENWDDMDLSQRRMFLSGDFTDGNAATVKRERVCAIEVWCECFNGDPKQFTNTQAREIRNILDNAPGWKNYSGYLRFKIYGRQRANIRG